MLRFCCSIIGSDEKFACGKESLPQSKCQMRNCCFEKSSIVGVPSCYFPSKEAAGAPIKHPNGLCICPENGVIQDRVQTVLIWSKVGCSFEEAVFLVSYDHPTYHLWSGKCINPKNRKPGDPGNNGELVLEGNKCKSTTFKFRQAANGNLGYYYLNAKDDLCIGAGSSTPEPKEGDKVKLSPSACTTPTKCRHLSYVREKRVSSNKRESISCPASSLIKVTWANYGLLVQNHPAVIESQTTECTTSNATEVMKRMCDRKKICTFTPSPSDFFKGACTETPLNLVVRYTCVQDTKPDRPSNVVLKVLGQTNLKVLWTPEVTSDPTFTFWYSICWSTKKIPLVSEEKCKSLPANSSSGFEVTGLQPSTLYFINVARLNCDRATGSPRQEMAITRAAALQQSGNVSHDNFKIRFGTPQDDDSYVQIVVLKLAVNRPRGRAPDSYQASDLKAYNPASRGNVPYVAAEVSSRYIRGNPQFIVGDGKSYSRSSTRKRRSTSFLNAKLDPGAFYSVFQRTFKAGGLYYNSEWSDIVKTLLLVTTAGPDSTTIANVMSSPSLNLATGPDATTSSKALTTTMSGDRSNATGQSTSGANKDDSDKVLIWAVVAVVLAIIFLVLLITILICFIWWLLWRKKRSGDSQSKEGQNGFDLAPRTNTSSEYECPDTAANYEELRARVPEERNVYQSLQL